MSNGSKLFRKEKKSQVQASTQIKKVPLLCKDLKLLSHLHVRNFTKFLQTPELQVTIWQINN
jgi:hypothetical protein